MVAANFRCGPQLQRLLAALDHRNGQPATCVELATATGIARRSIKRTARAAAAARVVHVERALPGCAADPYVYTLNARGRALLDAVGVSSPTAGGALPCLQRNTLGVLVVLPPPDGRGRPVTHIAQRSALPRRSVRRAVLHLARLELAEPAPVCSSWSRARGHRWRATPRGAALQDVLVAS
jgi:hypothetical protein